MHWQLFVSGHCRSHSRCNCWWCNYVAGGHMSTYTQILYHIVFSTKDREPCLDADNRPNLFRDIWGIINKHHCHLYRINGVQDHIHILSSLHPTVALADLVKNIKLGSSSWIKESGAFPLFLHC